MKITTEKKYHKLHYDCANKNICANPHKIENAPNNRRKQKKKCYILSNSFCVCVRMPSEIFSTFAFVCFGFCLLFACTLDDIDLNFYVIHRFTLITRGLFEIFFLFLYFFPRCQTMFFIQ